MRGSNERVASVPSIHITHVLSFASFTVIRLKERVPPNPFKSISVESGSLCLLHTIDPIHAFKCLHHLVAEASVIPGFATEDLYLLGLDTGRFKSMSRISVMPGKE